mgnify:FL=1
MPIALTDAFGCDRCPHLFARSPDDARLVLLTGEPDSDPPSWIWDGQRWSPASVRGRIDILTAIALGALLVAIGGLAFALNLGWGRATWIWMLAVLTLAVLPAVLVRLASRH